MKIIVKAPLITCRLDQLLRGGRCVPCPRGAKRANDQASECLVEPCKENERVLNGRCVPCLPGERHNHGGDPSALNTECEPIICLEDERVLNNECVRCPAGSSRPAGDFANSYDTFCIETQCSENYYLQASECVPCPAGTQSPGGQAIECVQVTCGPGEAVKSNVCEACPPGHTHVGGALATGEDTDCTLIECRENEDFDGETCVTCPPGHVHPGRESIFNDQDCQRLVCGPGQQVGKSTYECEDCPPGTHSAGGHTVGDDHSACTTLVCPVGQGVRGNVCFQCPEGHTTSEEHPADGTDSDCEPVFCDPGTMLLGNQCIPCPKGHQHTDGASTCDQAVKQACADADVMFLMDMSGSIGPSNFTSMKTYVNEMAAGLGVSPNGVHGSVVTFANDAKLEFNFDEGAELANFQRSVSSLNYRPGQDSYIDRALLLAYKNLAAHSHADTPRIIIVLTDGRQTGDAGQLSGIVSQIKTLGALIIAIGIGENVDPKELALLVDHEDNMILGNFDTLTEQVEEAALTICAASHAGESLIPGGGSEPSVPPFPLSPTPSTGSAQCERLNQNQCRTSNQCDWCRWRNFCADKDQCPGGRRSQDLPDPSTLEECKCTGGGVKWSDISQSHFCWVSERPCVGTQGQVILRQWADCDEVACPASNPGVAHEYAGFDVHKHDGPFVSRMCYELPSKGKCNDQDKCRWCPAFRACAPRGLCGTLGSPPSDASKTGLKKKKATRIPHTPPPTPPPTVACSAFVDCESCASSSFCAWNTVAGSCAQSTSPGCSGDRCVKVADECPSLYEYDYAYSSDDHAPEDDLADCARTGNIIICADGRRFQIDRNGFNSPVQEKNSDTHSHEDHHPPRQQPPRRSFKDVLGELTVRELGSEVDPVSGQHCLSAQDLCMIPGNDYCCKWQRSLVQFYRRLNTALGPPNDPSTGTHCLSVEEPCDLPGHNYCCKWQSSLLVLYN